MLLPKTSRIYCYLIDKYIKLLTFISITSSLLLNESTIKAYLHRTKIHKCRSYNANGLICPAKFTACANVIRFMIFSQKVSVIS